MIYGEDGGSNVSQDLDEEISYDGETSRGTGNSLDGTKERENKDGDVQINRLTTRGKVFKGNTITVMSDMPF